MQAEGESPHVQEVRTREYAERQGWKVVEVYRLDGVSGAISLDHPEARRMVKDVESRRVEAVIATRFARVSRDAIGLRLLVRKFEQLGAKLISLDENIDTATPEGKLFLGLLADLAEHERRLTAARVRESVAVRAREGKRLGGEAPYGYQWRDGKLVLHPQEAPVRRMVHELYLEHRRKKTVASVLNDQGHRTRRGNRWSDSTIEWLLRDPTAKGVHRLNYARSNGPGQGWSYKPEGEANLHCVEAIVPEEVWDAALELLETQRQARRRPAKKARQLFAGLVFCHCGRKMYVRSGSTKYVCSGCNQKIAGETLEQAFRRRLSQFPVDAGSLPWGDADEAIRSRRELLDSCEAKERQLERELHHVIELHRDGKLTGEAFDRVARPLQQQSEELQNQIPKLQAEVEFQRMQTPNPAALYGPDPTLDSTWPHLDFPARRELVESLLQRVTVARDNSVRLEIAKV